MQSDAVGRQAAENAERRELIPVRKKFFDLGFLRKRPLAALSDPARAGVLRKRGAAAQAVTVGFCIFCCLGRLLCSPAQHPCRSMVAAAPLGAPWRHAGASARAEWPTPPHTHEGGGRSALRAQQTRTPARCAGCSMLTRCSGGTKRQMYSSPPPCAGCAPPGAVGARTIRCAGSVRSDGNYFPFPDTDRKKSFDPGF